MYIIKVVSFLIIFNTGLLQAQSFNFEDTKLKNTPKSWVSDTTNRIGKLPKWGIIEDKSAPSPIHVLSLTQTDASGSTFNLCYTKEPNFLNGVLHVRFKSISGREDQGGGIMWRVLDADNYYVARFNPLEDNFRLYYVKDGYRKMLKSARISLSKDTWHSMKIVQNKNHYEAYLDGKKLLEGDDDTFDKSGGVGVWTKADALTSFDDFIITMKE
jgi:hypothetical protein